MNEIIEENDLNGGKNVIHHTKVCSKNKEKVHKTLIGRQFLLVTSDCPMFILLINHIPNKPWFLRVCIKTFENTVEKEEIARNEQFLLFPHCFLPV